MTAKDPSDQNESGLMSCGRSNPEMIGTTRSSMRDSKISFERSPCRLGFLDCERVGTICKCYRHLMHNASVSKLIIIPRLTCSCLSCLPPFSTNACKSSASTNHMNECVCKSAQWQKDSSSRRSSRRWICRDQGSRRIHMQCTVLPAHVSVSTSFVH
jgi:hypothetical protein